MVYGRDVSRPPVHNSMAVRPLGVKYMPFLVWNKLVAVQGKSIVVLVVGVMPVQTIATLYVGGMVSDTFAILLYSTERIQLHWITILMARTPSTHGR